MDEVNEEQLVEEIIEEELIEGIVEEESIKETEEFEVAYELVDAANLNPLVKDYSNKKVKTKVLLS